MAFWLGWEYPCKIIFSDEESDAVKIAAGNLKEDILSVFGPRTVVEAKVEEAPGKYFSEIYICTRGVGCKVDNRTGSFAELGMGICAENGAKSKGENLSAQENHPENVNSGEQAIRFAASLTRKEEYSLRVYKGALFITGFDRRGTIYGIYEVSRMIGVSPWVFWADVPVKRKDSFRLEEGFEKTDFPSVEYRGIFINDEEELEAWVQNRMGEETIGVKTYELVFELLLRLKANYIWPAMHVNSFNVKQENGALADRMGIVVGTSHCDMLMRSNNREWKPWLSKKGYEDVEYDYSVPGRNREILKEYWTESVEQNKDFEVCYTLGMRGIHDTGFETRGLDGLSEEAKKQAKIDLLQTIIDDQKEILRKTIGHETMTTFVPYKEVLPLYDGGLKVPEDVTLVWSNDNYGYIRRYPSEEERKRSGGNGVYYHNSYWAPPGMSYVFLPSTPLAHTAYELGKAYDEGIQKLMVLNVGAIKPLEIEIEFFLRFAWEVGRKDTLTSNVDAFVADFIDSNFSGGIGKKTALLFNDFTQMTNARKVEMMDQNAFSQNAYGDEAVMRIHEYERYFEEGNALYASLPEAERAAFFEMVLMRFHAAYFTNLAFYFGDRSTLMNARGEGKAADAYVKKTRQCEDARRRMLVYYNEKLLSGKWKGILNPEGFPPPRTAMMPVCTPPLSIGEPGMGIYLWNDEKKLHFQNPGTKWFEIGNLGTGELLFEVEAPDWVHLSRHVGRIQTESRILVTVGETDRWRGGKIKVHEKTTGVTAEISIVQEETFPFRIPCEEDGVVVVRANSIAFLPENFRRISRLGRAGGDLIEAKVPGGRRVDFSVYLSSSGAFPLVIQRFPSLNSIGRIRIGVSVDGGEMILAESESRDEHLGSWKENVRNNVDRVAVTLPHLEPGMHTISFEGIDPYFAFSGFTIYTKPPKKSNLTGAGFFGNQKLPREFDPEQFCDSFYGEIALSQRPVFYAPFEAEENTLTVTESRVVCEREGRKVVPLDYLAWGQQPAKEKDGRIYIDAASALARSEFANFEGDEWAYLACESYARSGLCMHVEEVSEKMQKGFLPKLNYEISCEGGEYVFWMLSKFDRIEESHFLVHVDGELLPKEKTWNRGCLFRYEAEQVYRWVPLVTFSLTEGKHTVGIACPGRGLRIDRLFLTRTKTLPPVDADWSAWR